MYFKRFQNISVDEGPSDLLEVTQQACASAEDSVYIFRHTLIILLYVLLHCHS